MSDETLRARTLKDYRPQHDEGCASHRCFVCQTQFHSNLRIDTHDHLGGTNKLHSWQDQECDCGLDALLALAAAAPPEQETP